MTSGGASRLLLLLLGCWSASSPAELPPRYLVGVEDIDYRPFQTTHAGVFEGFGRELLDAFAASEGIVFDYRPLPPSRLLVSLLQDRIDFKYPDEPDWSPDLRAEHRLYYSRPIVAYLDGTLVRPERLGRPVTELHTLGTVVGFTPLAWSERLRVGAVVLRENADFAALFQQVLSRRLDGAYANVAVARDQSRRILGRPDALVFDPGLPFARGDYRLSTRRHPGLIERFDRWLVARAAWVSELKRRAGLGDGVAD